MNNSKLNIERPSANKLILSGKIDATTAPMLHEVLKDIEPEKINLPLVWDMRKLSYVSSNGLREFLLAVKKFGKDGLLLENVRPEVIEILEATGFLGFFNYTPFVENENQNDDILNMSLRDFLKHKVNESGSKIALKSHGVSYTWQDIDKGSSAVASELYALGVRNKTHVAICGLNSLNWILTFYAIQKLGAIAVMLNPQLTVNEITNCSKIGDITHFCYGNMNSEDSKKEDFTAKITDPDKSCIKTTLDIRDSADFMNRNQKYDYEGHVMPDDVCLMIFTSGSTGTPKVVLLSAYNLLNSANHCVDNLHMNDSDKMCAILPFFHIFGLTAALLASAISGASIILPQNVKPDELLSVIDSERCTILHSVPTVLLRLVNAQGFSSELVSSLRASYLSGAPVSSSQLAMLMEKFPNNHFMRRYGLSEMTPATATNYNDSMEHILNTVGKTVEGAEIMIEDIKTGKKCPEGVTGEVILKGVNMMCGYYKLPVEKQPFDNEGFLHTGDLGFLDKDGYLHFAGRAKELIIRGGENIMPDEVASAISAHESVAEVKVMGVPDEVYGEIVAAAVVMKNGYVFDENAMRDFLMTRLAKFKIPSRFFLYDKLPTLPNNKIDAVSLKKEVISKINSRS